MFIRHDLIDFQLDLFNNGGDALNKEFREMLTRHSKVLPAVAILEIIEEGVEGSHCSLQSY